MKNKTLIVIFILIVLGLVYYFGFYKKGTIEENPKMANPAAVFCKDEGGTLKITTLGQGQKGQCVFDDGSECDEWEFFRGNCLKGQLKIEILKEGTGAVADVGKLVSVHYEGFLKNGTKFDSSLDRGTPFSFTLGASQVIKGWDEGVLGMKVGEKRKLTIAPELGYGDVGAGGVIPPKAFLIFEVELLAVQ